MIGSMIANSGDINSLYDLTFHWYYMVDMWENLFIIVLGRTGKMVELCIQIVGIVASF